MTNHKKLLAVVALGLLGLVWTGCGMDLRNRDGKTTASPIKIVADAQPPQTCEDGKCAL